MAYPPFPPDLMTKGPHPEHTKSTKKPRILHVWTRKERLKHFWQTCSHLTRFLTVGLGLISSSALIIYLMLWHAEAVAIFMASGVAVTIVSGIIYVVWVLTDPT